ncbi:Hydrogenase maturation protein, carbamoyltransferase HypF [Desulfovibrio legallii]|uniref:Carbamoyltransferase n=2 Tax=Desulfovibrio legallii TaxID=571438 RepID=A0A1G7P4F0_9BACT|nr:Hydrogenase maturation protein, carbamoyltransferase HypF [Desulfovibrio legallii]
MERRAFVACGQVQGVGFRPFVYRLAREEGLTGSVGNTSEGVRMEVQGPAPAVSAFGRRLRAELPPLARLTGVREEPLPLQADEAAFRIVPSQGHSGHSVLVSPDMGLCDQCLAEMRDPANPRHAYPFTNCTNCGPRYTITRAIPYDRAVTSMACFPLCPRCAAEYADPLDRRFHAQPIACPDCGPRLWFVSRADKAACRTAAPTAAPGRDAAAAAQQALRDAAALLLAGGILALKGLGGFQLACDARRADAVRALRQRKQRPHKPLALMTADLAGARSLCALTPEHEALLQSPEKPIVLCPCRADAALPPEIAPDTGQVGLMLPYTPLHAALFDLLAARAALPPVLVMTSANASGEPICLGNREALDRLERLADAWLLHDRDILVRVDDSVVTLQPGPAGTSAAQPLFYRRARGYVPRPVFLPPQEAHGPCVLGTGAELKATFCLTRGREAFVGQHIGDLENPATLNFYEEAAAHLEALLEVRPAALVCDLHPDFLSTRYARERAARQGLPLWSLQHHAAHAAAVLAENGRYAPALALCLDGTGLGEDGTVWGGELLLLELDAPRWQRLGRLAPFALPGGDAAVREPWRIALSLAQRAGLEDADWVTHDGGAQDAAIAAVKEMLRRKVNCPLTSSCGRLFDAAAAALGLCARTTYEGQAAIRLEDAAVRPEGGLERATAAALRGETPPPAAWGTVEPVWRDGLWEVDSARLFGLTATARREGLPVGEAAARFHLRLAASLARMAAQAAGQHGVDAVGLSGGVLQNALLARLLPLALRAHGLTPLTHHELPPGDGGLSLGQAVWGRRLLATGK